MAYYEEIPQINARFANVKAYVPALYSGALLEDGTKERFQTIANALRKYDAKFRIYRPSILADSYFVCTGFWRSLFPKSEKRRDVVGRVDFGQSMLHFGDNRKLCDLIQTALQDKFHKSFIASSA